MTGKTHRVGGMLCCLGGYMLLEKNGMLLGDVNPLLQLVVMYPFSLYGSTVSDLDHNWQSCPSKDVVSYGINTVLHLTEKFDREDKFTVLSIFNARHRSWQTHSDLFLAFMIWLASFILGVSSTNADQVIIKLVTSGLVLGIISHLVLDMLTPEGIWSIVMVVLKKILGVRYLPYKISFVPDAKFFRTGGAWETLIRWFMWLVCLVLFGMILLSVSPYDVHFLRG